MRPMVIFMSRQHRKNRIEIRRSMDPEQLKNIIEAVLMVSERPVSITQLLALFEKELDRP